MLVIAQVASRKVPGLPDRTTLIRLHHPQKTADRLERPSLKRTHHDTSFALSKPHHTATEFSSRRLLFRAHIASPTHQPVPPSISTPPTSPLAQLDVGRTIAVLNATIAHQPETFIQAE